MESSNLSKKAIHLLQENGYSFKKKDGRIAIKRTNSYMGAVVLLFVTLFLSIPVFSAGAIYGVILIAAVVGAIVIRKIFFTHRSSLLLDLNAKTFTAIVGTYHQEDQSLKMISAIKLNSKFIDEYTTAARNSVEEHLISITIQLITKEEITLFHFKSDQAEPSAEINEVYSLIEDIVKTTKSI
ncbi:hypothetical protein [Ekhidna sp.]